MYLGQRHADVQRTGRAQHVLTGHCESAPSSPMTDIRISQQLSIQSHVTESRDIQSAKKKLYVNAAAGKEEASTTKTHSGTGKSCGRSPHS